MGSCRESRAHEFERRTPEVVGTRIRVVGTDGSVHIEEIVEWEPARRMTLRMDGFSAPLGWFSTHFDEAWEVIQGGKRDPGGSRVRAVSDVGLHAARVVGDLAVLEAVDHA